MVWPGNVLLRVVSLGPRREFSYHEVAGNLRVKQVVIDDATMRDRFVVCHNPGEAIRDQAVRQQLLEQITDAITGSDRLTATERDKIRAALQAKRGLKRFLRTTNNGLLRIDRAAVASEAHLDGKYLLRTSDPTLTADDIALAYKQLLQVERGWRDMKTTLDLRPVRHRKQDRIRAHVILCWLALLLIRIAEHQADDTWTNLRDELQRLHVGTFTGPAGSSSQPTEITSRQQQILNALHVPAPPPACPPSREGASGPAEAPASAAARARAAAFSRWQGPRRGRSLGSACHPSTIPAF